MKLFKNISGQELLALLTPIILVIPNAVLNFTEHLPLLTSIVNIVLPLSVYLLITTAFKKVGITVWCLLPIMIYCGFQIVLLYLYGCSIIGVDMFLNVVTSNPGEIAELLGNLIIAIGSLVIVYIPALVYATICISKKLTLRDSFVYHFRRISAIAVSAGIILLAINFFVTPGFAIFNDIFPANVSKNLALAFKRYAQVSDYPITSADFKYNATATHPDSIQETYVVVIGETSRAENWELLGYNRNTNPLLSKTENIVAMPHAITQSATTHKSVPMILSPITAVDFDSINYRKSFISAFKEAGFYTAFFSNQKRNRSYTEYFGNEADKCEYISDDATVQPYDIELINLLEKEIADTTHTKKLIVLHSYGSHFNYSERYPREAAFFTPDNKTDANREHRQELINAYDNTIRYIDYCLHSAISALEKSGNASALIYASDHGEDIFDDSRERFLHASPIPTYYQLHVPMIIWTSNRYNCLYTEKAENLRINRLKIVSPTVSLFNTLIDLAGLQTTYSDSTASLANEAFRSPELFFLSDRNEPVKIDSTSVHKYDFTKLKEKHFIKP